ncbi:CHAD domain-containing protein [Leifsonia xyli]|uniref:CHAD domain-containing protein n=1 Tax=Leifsonia xyli TaxID=1575 RepID=UPI003D677D2A
MYALVRVSAELAVQLVAIETGGEDAVHQARTRVRRLRSILAVYRPAFDRDAAAAMRARLRRLGHRLGDVRDLEVRARDLGGLALEAGEGEAGGGPVAEAVGALAAQAAERHDRALDALLRTLRSRGNRELLADLQQFAAAPPLSEAGAAHPAKVARKRLKKAVRKVVRSEGEALEQRHEARKAARRLRYAAEAVEDDLGNRALRLATAAETLQDTLGDHRDLVLLARHLRDNDPGGVLDELAASCEARAQERLGDLDDAYDAIEW